MNAPQPTFSFVQAILRRLARAQLATWLGGGWAEELWELSAPRPHQDVDLWYPALNFGHLDRWLTRASDLTAIPAKHFAHKRAFLWEGIIIEVILLEPNENGGYLTKLFNGRSQLVWPPDPLRMVHIGDHRVPVGSPEALRFYRQQHQMVVEAYQMYLQQQT